MPHESCQTWHSSAAGAGTAQQCIGVAGRLLNDLDQLRETVLQSPEQAEQAFQQFHDQWEKSERRLNLVVWRDKVVQIDVTVAHLTPMLGADCDELDSELSEARMWIQRLSESEMPFWWNIL